MYNFVFWFFYKFFEWRKGFQSPFLAGAMVVLAISFHLILIHSVIRYFTGFTVGTFSDNYGYNKLIMLPIVLALFFTLYLVYYKKKASQILSRYNGYRISSLRNILLVMLILVVPLIITIVLTNMAVRKYTP
jgi:hypothetical protein